MKLELHIARPEEMRKLLLKTSKMLSRRNRFKYLDDVITLESLHDAILDAEIEAEKNLWVKHPYFSSYEVNLAGEIRRLYYSREPETLEPLFTDDVGPVYALLDNDGHIRFRRPAPIEKDALGHWYVNDNEMRRDPVEVK